MNSTSSCLSACTGRLTDEEHIQLHVACHASSSARGVPEHARLDPGDNQSCQLESHQPADKGAPSLEAWTAWPMTVTPWPPLGRLLSPSSGADAVHPEQHCSPC